MQQEGEREEEEGAKEPLTQAVFRGAFQKAVVKCFCLHLVSSHLVHLAAREAGRCSLYSRGPCIQWKLRDTKKEKGKQLETLTHRINCIK